MSSAGRRPRYCACGTRLAGDNRGRLCAACQSKGRDLMLGPPRVPPEFWHTVPIRDALAQWHIGQVIAAYRHHPHHGRVLRQEIVARWVGLTQAQLSRIETGPPVKDLDKLSYWARVLGIPPDLLWFRLPQARPGQRRQPPEASRYPATGAGGGEPGAEPPPAGMWEVDDINRRELLRLTSTAGTAIAVGRFDLLDGEQLGQTAPDRPDPATLDQLAALNTRLWQAFTTAPAKATLLPAVQEQLQHLTRLLRSHPGEATYRRLCGIAGDLFQLAGEIYFDANRYTEAAHSYTLAATACQHADMFDLWACALTRHAFIGVYERRFQDAIPMLELAAGIAGRGDSRLSTRHWVQAVTAQAHAGRGDIKACRRALDHAQQVTELDGQPNNGGWLRFDGSRLAEEQGACYVELRQPDLAEPVLRAALDQHLSARRRGTVLTDLALVGLQRRDPDQTVSYASAALDTVRQTRSGVVARRLHHLQRHLAPLQTDRHIRHLSRQIAELTSTQPPSRGDHRGP